MMYKGDEFRTSGHMVAAGGDADRPAAARRISRATDILVSGIALLVLSPLMLLIIAGILIEIGRPVFYTQIRTGEGGRKFRIIKFRKFHVSNDDAGPLLTVTNDARMSRFGRLLEKTKLDELPQFLNVLLGDMAIVGPRPQNEIATLFFTREYRALLDYRPGIFGPSQVAFRSEAVLYPADVDRHEFYRERLFPVKARLDFAYYPHRTWLGDMVWMIRGILAVVGLHPVLRELPQSLAAPGSDARATGVAEHGSKPLGVRFGPMHDMLDPRAGTQGTV